MSIPQEEQFEIRQVGNMHPEDIYSTDGEDIYGEPGVVPSLAQQWRDQGIRWEQTDPVPSDKYTSDQIKAMGYFGITLYVPKTAETE